jgi:hypothetical protein
MAGAGSKRLALAGILFTALMAGCASVVPPIAEDARAHVVTPFSSASSEGGLPNGWQPWIMSRVLNNTRYRIVRDDGKPVLEARSESAASGLLQEVSIDPAVHRFISWRWKAAELIPAADNARRGTDDSPVRVIVAFDGDRSKFDFEDRAMADMAKLMSGREMPYATIMYIWENKLPVDTILDNAVTSRAKMIVAESGPKRVGQWLTFKRDLVEDYRRAYGEEPGRIISVGVMTDSNSTGTNVTAYYGDISLLSTDSMPMLANGAKIAR